MTTANMHLPSVGVPSLTKLQNWLLDRKVELECMGQEAASQNEVFWEDLLTDLGDFDDAGTYELFEQSANFEYLKTFFTQWFGAYAHVRDIKRGNKFVDAYQQKGGIDRLSSDMQVYLAEEWSKLRQYHSANNNMDGAHLVSVGCGASPETFIYYLNKFDKFGTTTGLDYNTKAARLGHQNVRKLGFEKAMIQQADGTTASYESYDIIHVANYVHPKTRVLKTIAKTAKPNTTVVVRVPTLLENLICDSLDFGKLEEFELLGKATSNYCKMDTVYLRLKHKP